MNLYTYYLLTYLATYLFIYLDYSIRPASYTYLLINLIGLFGPRIYLHTKETIEIHCLEQGY